jgi:hypothetical protein
VAEPTARQRYVPMWPQPGLRPRDARRGCTIRRIGYFGRTSASPAWLFDPAFHAALREIGVELAVRAREWHDYEDVDMVLACRSESRTMLMQKPASKIINGWLAGVPVAASPEPAFEALRTSPLDYLAVHAPRDVIASIEALRRSPATFGAMVENGIRRAQAFTVSATRNRWLTLLEDEVLPDFRRRMAWHQRPGASAIAMLHLLQQKCEGRCFKLVVGLESRFAHVSERSVAAKVEHGARVAATPTFTR